MSQGTHSQGLPANQEKCGSGERIAYAALLPDDVINQASSSYKSSVRTNPCAQVVENAPSIGGVSSEIWRPVVGYEGWYEVSNLGSVRRACPGRHTYAGRPCRTQTNTYGYSTIELCAGVRRRGVRTTVHKMVAEAFLGPRPKHLQVNHRNGIKTDNRVSNLEYVTASENIRHAYANIPRRRVTKLTEGQVETIRIRLAFGIPCTRIATEFGVTGNAIAKIRDGKTWNKCQSSAGFAAAPCLLEGPIPVSWVQQ